MLVVACLYYSVTLLLFLLTLNMHNPIVRSLFRNTHTLSKLQSHTDFLVQCQSSRKTPKGLQIRVQPQVIGQVSKRFQSRWDAILRKVSAQLMSLLINRLHYQMQQVSRRIDETKLVLQNTLSPEDFTEVVENNNRTTANLQQKLSCTKRRKLHALGVHSDGPNAPPGAQNSNSNIQSHTRKKLRRFTKRNTALHSNINTPHNTVVNLSSTELSQGELSLLSKGLNFCPKQPQYDQGHFFSDVRAFNRRLRLKSHFSKPEPLFDNSRSDGSQTQTQSSNPAHASIGSPDYNLHPSPTDDNHIEKYPQFRPKSDWQPPKQTVALETFIHNVESELTSHDPHYDRKSNLTRQETKALHSLKKRTDIVIKPADKGSAVVVMDRDHYISEAERQLNDKDFYKLLEHDPTLEYAERVSQKLEAMVDEGHISEKNLEYLTVTSPKAGRFYLLPKIHKAGNPGRPIVSANGHPTEKISEFIDFHLRPHVNRLPSHIQDTTDYLNKTDSVPCPDNTLLVSLDVVSLYTNIPHADGIEACREAWDSRDIKDPPTETLVDLLKLVLQCNNFTFDNKHYLQVQGTAMGTKMAPSYANVFMGRLENCLLQSVPLTPSLWLRFIDDIDMRWPHGQDTLSNFLTLANSFHPSIKFTHEVSNDRHIFLDTVSKLDNTGTHVDVYSKPTDTHQYLLPSSCHPKHCARNIPYSQALRIRRICSDEDTFEIRASELKQNLEHRGYSSNLVSDGIDKAREQNRSDLLQYRPVQKTSRIPFVVTYHPNLPNLRQTIDRNWSNIENCPRLHRLFPEKPIIAYRRPKSIRDILVRAKLPQLDNPTVDGGSGPCGDPRCKTCQLMPVTNTFSSTNGAVSTMNSVTNCKSSNVIYLMTCTVCNKQYVGETKLTIAKRMNLHRSDWSLKRFSRSPVAEHCYLPNHTFTDMRVRCIEHNKNWSDAARKNRETYWIRRLHTLTPSGINKGD